MQEHFSLILEKGHKELSYLVAIDFFIVSIFYIFPRTKTICSKDIRKEII